MKKASLALIAVIVLALTVTSCYSSRKGGCPMNVNGTSKFRG